MNEYSISLALTYFKERREQYTIGEMAEILGYNRKQVEELIDYLMSQNYVDYVENLLAITPKGIRFLISNNQDSIHLRDDEIITPNINLKNAQSIDEPYVPKNFTKKYISNN